MTDENIEVDAEDTPVPEEVGGGKKKRKKLTFKEQMKEIRAFFVMLLIAGLAYGGYYFGPMFVGTSFTLEDQFQKERIVDFSGDKPVVLMFLHGEGSKLALPWAFKMVITYGDRLDHVRLINIQSAVAEGRPGLTRMMVQRMTKESLLLDFGGRVFTRYFCEEDTVNIIVVAPNRLVKHRVTGKMNDENWAALAAVIDSLIEVEVATEIEIETE